MLIVDNLNMSSFFLSENRAEIKNHSTHIHEDVQSAENDNHFFLRRKINTVTLTSFSRQSPRELY